MKDREKILKFLKDHKNFLKESFGVKKIALFGSFAKGEENIRSDIDILIEFEGNKDIYKKKKMMKNFLKKHLKREIEIANIKYLKDFVKQDILNEAKYV